MPWTKEEKIFCVTTYLETKSFKTVQAKFRRKLNFNNYPQKNQIYRWTHKFQAIGSVNNLNKNAETLSSGRKLTARSPDNVNAVRDSVGRSPKKSIRRRSQELGLSRATVQRILISCTHTGSRSLTPADVAQRVVMCRWFENKIEERFPDRLINRRRAPEWSPHSPDLNPQKFYLGVLEGPRV